VTNDDYGQRCRPSAKWAKIKNRARSWRWNLIQLREARISSAERQEE